MGSITGSATLPLAVWLVMQAPWPAVGASVVAGAFVIYRHSSNIERLRLGTESVFKF
jgi:glycerol-3-phosphate acyltransferase PlsY